MNITKIGHCCLLIEVDGTRLLTDPGCFSDGQNTLENIDAVLITHEHADHLHIPSLQEIAKHNPNATVYTNTSTAALLDEKNIAHSIMTEGGELDIKGVKVQTWNCDHAEIYEDITPVLNTALLINDTLLYPGDAFYIPNVGVHTLALPIVAPWCKTSEVIDYAKTINPTQCFSVHDGLLHAAHGAPFRMLAAKFVEAAGIKYLDIKEGETFTI